MYVLRSGIIFRRILSRINRRDPAILHTAMDSSQLERITSPRPAAETRRLQQRDQPPASVLVVRIRCSSRRPSIGLGLAMQRLTALPHRIRPNFPVERCPVEHMPGRLQRCVALLCPPYPR
ncbi:hypothetical protein J3F83DRAFT_744908 [Trichoderma novae-zelandiae]